MDEAERGREEVIETDTEASGGGGNCFRVMVQMKYLRNFASRYTQTYGILILKSRMQTVCKVFLLLKDLHKDEKQQCQTFY